MSSRRIFSSSSVLGKIIKSIRPPIQPISCKFASTHSKLWRLSVGESRKPVLVDKSRSISQTSVVGSYEGDGKTTITILNREQGSPLMVDGYYTKGFSLNNGFKVRGPMAIFPKTVLAWDVGSSEDITPQSLAIFTVLEPKLDILIIGVGVNGCKVPVETIKMLKSKKINFEILPTEHALSTFNFLNFERRSVAAALIPPEKFDLTPDDFVRNRIEQKKLYEKDWFNHPKIGDKE